MMTESEILCGHGNLKVFLILLVPSQVASICHLLTRLSSVNYFICCYVFGVTIFEIVYINSMLHSKSFCNF